METRSLKYMLAVIAALIINLSATPSFATDPLRYWAVAVGTANPTDAELLPVIADIDPGEATSWNTGLHGWIDLAGMEANYETIIAQIGTYFNEAAAEGATFAVTFMRYVQGTGTREAAEYIFMYLPEAARNQVIRRGFQAITRNISNRLRIGPAMDTLIFG